MSVIHFKFKNASRKWDTVTFDGNVISVLDLKRAIVIQKKLHKSLDDFDLLFTNAQTGEGLYLFSVYSCLSVVCVCSFVPCLHSIHIPVLAFSVYVGCCVGMDVFLFF